MIQKVMSKRSQGKLPSRFQSVSGQLQFLKASVCAIGLLFLPLTFVGAETISYQPVDIPLEKDISLVVSVNRGQIIFKHIPRSKSLKIQLTQHQPSGISSKFKKELDEWLISVQRKGQEIWVEVQRPEGKEEFWSWENSKKAPRFDVVISGPSLPARVALGNGSLQVENWQKAMVAHLEEGSAKVKGGSGALYLSSRNADLSVKNRKSFVQLDSFSGNLKLFGVDGQISVSQFAGKSQIDQSKGSLNLRVARGISEVSFKGQLKLEAAQPRIRLKRFEGQLSGQIQGGDLRGRVVGESKVRLQSDDASIQLNADGGTRLFLVSQEGRVFGPNNLRAQQGSRSRYIKGRINGSGGGRVDIRAKKGFIAVR